MVHSELVAEFDEGALSGECVNAHRVVAQDMSFRYAGCRELAVANLNVDVSVLRCLAILGESGCGKSTLLRVCCGAYGPRNPGLGDLRGRVEIDGQQPASLLEDGQSLGVMWQGAELFPHLSLSDNIALPARVAGLPNAERLSDDAVRFAELGSVRQRRPSAVSGGQRARAALARSLVCQPRYLFLDEPLANLDIGTKWRVLQRLREKMEGRLVLFATHDLLEACLMADQIVVLGRVRESGVCKVISNTPPPPTPNATLREMLEKATATIHKVAEQLEEYASA